MHLIAPLISGIAGAELGTVDFYRRGTSTRVTYYSDFEGTVAVTPTASVSLDDNGGGIFYVNELVTCVVKDVDGEPLREFVAGDNASAVEVISQSFTGVDYETGASAASKPVPLSTVLDRWYTSAGAIDWNVLLAGSSSSIKNALSTVGGIVFNVKAPAYAAVGDGVNDDTSAIAAANTAAQAVGGGIVWFPPGTYRSTAALVPGAGVSFMGAGPGASILTIDSTTASLFTYTSATTTEPQFVRGLRLKAAQANTGTLLHVNAAASVHVDDCYIGGPFSTDNSVLVANASGRLLMTNSVAEIGGASGIAVEATSGRVDIDKCQIVMPATFNSAGVELDGAGGTIANCFFANAAVTSGTFIDVIAGSNGVGVIGCTFPNAGGATVSAIYDSGFVGVSEIGCSFGTTVTRTSPVITAAATTHAYSPSTTRDAHRYYVASDGAALTINPNLYSELEVERTTTGNQTLTLTTPTQGSMDFCLIYNNDHAGGGGTITWAGNVEPAAATFAVNANKVTYHFFRSVQTKQLNYYWVQYGTLANQAP